MEWIETKEMRFEGILTQTEIILSLRCPECRKWTPLRKSKCGLCGYVMYTDKDIIRVRERMKAHLETFWTGPKVGPEYILGCRSQEVIYDGVQ